MAPESKDLNYMLTSESRRRKIPNLKSIYELMRRPGMVSLAGGTPNASIFPFDGVGSYSLKAPFAKGVTESKISGNHRLKYKVFHSDDETPAKDSRDIELTTSLQYGAAIGDDRLRDFLKSHVSQVHEVGFADWDLILSVGNTFAWDAVLRTFCEPTDVILFEEFTFPSALENAQTRGCDTYGVKIDSFGIVPEDLEAKARKYRPKLLYTVPTGQNPTGSILTPSRRAAIAEIARKYDFLIVEDEPYYYLQMHSTNIPKDRSLKEYFLDSLVPSFLHYDTDGRVIRLDSFSKIMAPGIRMGWVIAQQRFTDALRVTMESSSSKPSGFAQSLVYGLLLRWGQLGLIQWLHELQLEYKERRDVFLDAFANALDDTHKHRIQYSQPQAGMFFWLTLKVPENAAVLEQEFFQNAADNDVLVVPGRWCKVESLETGDDDTTIYFRGTFASESKEALVVGAKRLAAAVNEYLDPSFVTRTQYLSI